MEKTAFRDTVRYKIIVLAVLGLAVAAAFIIGNVWGTMYIFGSDIFDNGR